MSGGIYFVDTFAAGLPDLDGGTKSERAGTGKGTGKSWWEVWTGQKTSSGTNMQVETLRLRIDETGNVILFTDKIFADNAAAIAGDPAQGARVARGRRAREAEAAAADRSAGAGEG